MCWGAERFPLSFLPHVRVRSSHKLGSSPEILASPPGFSARTNTCWHELLDQLTFWRHGLIWIFPLGVAKRKKLRIEEIKGTIKMKRMNWREWKWKDRIEENELKRMNWREWKWREWIKENELKRMNWREWNEEAEMKRKKWRERIKRMKWREWDRGQEGCTVLGGDSPFLYF